MRNAVLLVAVLLASCAHKPANMTPGQSAEFEVTRSLAVLAESNKAATAGAIKLQQLGVVSVPTTNAILGYTKAISAMDRSAVTILKSSSSWVERSKVVFDLVKTLKLPPEVSVLLNSPATDQGVKGLISTIQSLQLLLGNVATVTGVK